MQDSLLQRWETVKAESEKMKEFLRKDTGKKTAFAFVEGVVTQALRNGDWVLLDEVNLAEKEVLVALCSIFSSQGGFR